MLNLPYAYFYGANMMPGSFQYGTPALYPQQLATNASSNAQFAKPSYNSAYGSSGYDALGQSTQDYNKTAYPGSGTQQSKGQNVSNQPPSGTGSDISSSMYGNKNHAALSKVNVSTTHLHQSYRFTFISVFFLITIVVVVITLFSKLHLFCNSNRFVAAPILVVVVVVCCGVFSYIHAYFFCSLALLFSHMKKGRSIVIRLRRLDKQPELHLNTVHNNFTFKLCQLLCIT